MRISTPPYNLVSQEKDLVALTVPSSESVGFWLNENNVDL